MLSSITKELKLQRGKWVRPIGALQRLGLQVERKRVSLADLPAIPKSREIELAYSQFWRSRIQVFDTKKLFDFVRRTVDLGASAKGCSG